VTREYGFGGEKITRNYVGLWEVVRCTGPELAQEIEGFQRLSIVVEGGEQITEAIFG
jgi:hypothetical protein